MKNLRFLLIILLILSTSYAIGSTATQFIPLCNIKSQQCYDIKIIESNINRYKARVKIYGIRSFQILQNEYNFQKITFEEDKTHGEKGQPEFPIISQNLCVPPNANFNVCIQDSLWTDISIGYIFPHQEECRDSYISDHFLFNADAYSTDAYLPQIVQASEIMTYLNVKNVFIDVCPFKYYPQEKKLSIMTEFTLCVNFNSIKTQGTSSEKSEIYERDAYLLRKSFMNSDIIPSILNVKKGFRANTDSCDYLVIAGNIPGVMNCKALRDFRKWKAFKGLKSKLVSTASIGDNCDNIKSFIQDEYDASGNNLKYVLLVGDFDKIPCKILPQYKFSTDTTFSDSWYGCMDGPNDAQIDVAIGRLSTNDTIEMQNMVSKTIKYESNYYSYYDGRALLVANAEGAPGRFQDCLEAIRTMSYSTTSFSFEKLYGASNDVGGDDATNSDVINAINSGYNIINYRGHGIPNNWPFWNVQNEWFHSSQIDNVNDSICSVFLNVACQLANIRDSATCMMEVFTRVPYGGVVFLGATLDTERSYNNLFNKNFYKTLLNDSITNIGLAINEACKSLSPSYFGRLNIFRYLCGGDSSIDIWTDQPKSFSDVTCNLLSGWIHISLPSVNDAKLSVVTEDGQLLSVQKLINNTFTIAAPSVNCYFVINKHNYIPYIIKYDRTSHYVQNETFNHDVFYASSPLNIGSNVTNSKPFGDVVVKKGHTLSIKGNVEVTIKNGFNVEKGAVLDIK